MTINHDGWLVNYSYSFEKLAGHKSLMPHQGGKLNLCNLFWRTIFVTLGWSLLLAGAGGILFLIGWGSLAFVRALLHSHDFRMLMLFSLLGTAVIIGLVLYIVHLRDAWKARRDEYYYRGETPPPNELWKLTKEYIKAKKEKYCPIIDVV